MGLCKFFQQGTCRFGSKCHNEHFDVKQVLKTDVESAINGKQWPLSSYGPFKDKPSIPNFIEDRSFEEVRLMCYEAKQKNFFEQFHMQFTKEVMDASNKMKALLQLTPEIVDVVINVYDTSGTENSGTGPPAAKSNNPFGMTAGVSSTAGSIFAKTSTATAPTSNIFGAAAASGGFSAANAGGGMFVSTSSQQAGSIFGGGSSTFGLPQQQQQPQQQGSIFGQAAKPANSIFGGSANAPQQPSLFAQQQSSAVGGNLFAQAQVQPQQQQPSVGGAFSSFSQQQPQQQSSMFVQPQQSNNMFAQPGQTAQSTNMFLQTAQQPLQQQGIFAQAAGMHPQTQQQPAAGQGVFAQVAPQHAMQQQQQTANTGQGLFAQASQQTQNMFSQAMQQQPQQQQQQVPSQSVFQQSQQTSQQQLQNQQQQPASAAADIFKQAAQQQAGQHPPGSSLYSRMEDLTAEEIEAFKADTFQPGKLPFNPPPRELIN